MTTSTPSSVPRPSVIRRCFGWPFSRRGLRSILFAAVVVATLFGLLYAVENWRGRRAWDAYRTEATARGVILDYAKLMPPSVPDDQNFALTPFFQPLFDFEPGSQKPRDLGAQLRTREFATQFLTEVPAARQEQLRSVVSKEKQQQMNGDWRRGWPRDQVAIYLLHKLDTNNPARSAPGFAPDKIDATTAAADILDNLRKFDPIMAEIRQAAQRPFSRFKIHYEEEDLASVQLPHLGVLKNLAQLLSYRASAQLVLRRTDDALDDILLGMRLSDALDKERTLISYLVRIAIVNLVVQPVWEGLADRQWSDGQLQTLAKAFARENPIVAMNYALDGERGFSNSIIEYLRRKPQNWNTMINSPESTDQTSGRAFVSVMPSGWFYFEQVEYNKMFDAMLKDAIGASDHQIDPVAYTKYWAGIETALHNAPGQAFWRHQAFAQLLLPYVSKVVQRTANMEATLAEVRTAIALDRFSLVNKSYPETLAALVPSYLAEVPKDVIKGGPLKYQRTADGRYQLYSLGWNGVDDGGKRVLVREGGKPLADDGGDWVWSYSAE